jgi:GNAT superfamily N-acetyltransferase/catechol 2,3-dioxygenase-like lactoylglutathione lyase family enzyme
VNAESVEIRPVRSRSDLRRFIRLPWRIYRNEPLWVPPLVYERKRFLDRDKNPFFSHGEAEYFLAWRGDEVVGRITAHIDRDFNDFHKNEWGMFGFFESEDDPEVAQALLDAAGAWLRERGRDRMVGPMDFTLNDESGIVIDGFDLPPMIKQPYHPRYYQALVEGVPGFEKAQDLQMWNLEVTNREKVLPIIWEMAEKLEPEHGIRVRHLQKRDLQAELDRFLEIYNIAWSENWGFVPIRREEMEHTAKEMRPILDEDWMMACDTADGDTVGIALTIPDINQVLKRMNGRLLPLGWLKFLLYRRRIDRLRVGFLGVKPEYQHTGVAAAMWAEHFRMAAVKPQSGGEMGWILETNTAMNRAMEAMGGRIVKRYRVYERVFR